MAYQLYATGMSKEIVIQASKKETRIAIVEDGKLAELYIENPENARTIGDIHLGRVRNVMPSIQAAFVNIGQKQDAFLHFSDVGETLGELLEMVGESPEPSSIDVHVPRVHRSIRVELNGFWIAPGTLVTVSCCRPESEV